MNAYDMGSVFSYQGRFGAALTSRQDALKAFTDLKDRTSWMVEALAGYGESLGQAGVQNEATQANLDQAMTLAREQKNESLVSQVLRNQGDVASYRGDLKGARAFYDQSMQSATHAKDNEKILLARLAIARNDLQQGRAAAGPFRVRSLGQQAESQGLKYEAVQSWLDLGEALMATKSLRRRAPSSSGRKPAPRS